MITTLTGKNSFALRDKLKSITDKTVSELGDLGLEKIDAEEVEFNSLLRSVQSLPFLVPKKTIIVSNVAKSPELLERVDEIVERTPEQVDVVLVGPILDKRKSYFKEFKEHTNLIEFPEQSQNTLPGWVVTFAKKQGSEINFNDAKYFVERVGTNQLMLSNEIKKLSLLGDKITRFDINELTELSAQSSIFALLDNAFTDSKKSIKLYKDQRRQKVDPHYIISMLTWQLYNLALAVHANPQNEQTLIDGGLSPYVAKNSLRMAKNVSKQKLKTVINRLAEIDGQIKSSADADAALELFLLEISS